MDRARTRRGGTRALTGYGATVEAMAWKGWSGKLADDQLTWLLEFKNSDFSPALDIRVQAEVVQVLGPLRYTAAGGRGEADSAWAEFLTMSLKRQLLYAALLNDNPTRFVRLLRIARATTS